MQAYPNHAKQRLEQGKISTGLGLRQARTADIAARSARRRLELSQDDPRSA